MRLMGRLLATGTVVGMLLVLATDALAATPTRGRIYDAIAGNRDPGSGTGQSFFSVEVSADGRRVTLPGGQWDLPCTGGPSKGGDLAPSTAATTVKLKSNGSFAVSLSQVDSNSTQPVHDSPVVVRGRFVSSSEATGTISFTGISGDDTGCDARARWTSHLRPLNDHFAGTTSTGAVVTFDRTVERHPVVWNFSVGDVPAQCYANPASVLDVRDAFVGRVRNRRWHTTTEDANAEAVTISGRFITRRSASGTVGEQDRGGCFFNGIGWSAHLTGRSSTSSP